MFVFAIVIDVFGDGGGGGGFADWWGFLFCLGGVVCFFAVCSSSVGLTGLLVGCSLGLFLGKGRGGVVFCSVNWEEVGSRGGEEELKV